MQISPDGVDHLLEVHERTSAETVFAVREIRRPVSCRACPPPSATLGRRTILSAWGLGPRSSRELVADEQVIPWGDARNGFRNSRLDISRV